jgi:hypothetical protein
MRESVKDEFEHPDMLYPGLRNSNDITADGIFGNHRMLYYRIELANLV